MLSTNTTRCENRAHRAVWPTSKYQVSSEDDLIADIIAFPMAWARIGGLHSQPDGTD
jgi:hypothetical protein